MTTRRSTVLVAGLAFAAGGGLGWVGRPSQQTTHREPQFENEQVRVWKSIIMPKQPLSYHRHDHGRALIALTDGELKVLDQEGRQIDTYRWERGKAYWLGADPPGKLHADLNETAQPIEVIVVELKKD
ncbi:MAG TPA: hypothetical protein VJK71_08090 [Gemmatimonadales bacterium]|nr:hypothetical protein [Gemmatimonadales bacterium]